MCLARKPVGGAGERLEGRLFWQAIERFRCVRLLGAQPTNAGFDRVICEIYVANHGIEPARSKRQDEDPCRDSPANRPFADLKSDFPADKLTHFVDGIKARWPDMVSPKDRDRCRDFLVNLVAENIQRLTALLELHEEYTEQDAQRTVTRLGYDRSRDVELMRRNERRYRVALDRSIKTYDMVHGKDREDKEDDRIRRTASRSPIPPYRSGGRRGGARRNTALDATETSAGDAEAGMPDGDIQWAIEKDVLPRLKGQAFLIRYADDFVIGVAREDDAQRILEVLPKRMSKYGLTVHPEKTRLVRFEPSRDGDSGTSGEQHTPPRSFDFLGFTHYWGRTLQGFWTVKRQTAKNRLRRALQALWEWCRVNRHLSMQEQQADCTSWVKSPILAADRA
jgi:hypothetical protein